MAYTDAGRRATNKYRSTRERMNLDVSKEQKARWQEAAKADGKSLNQWVKDKLDGEV